MFLMFAACSVRHGGDDPDRAAYRPPRHRRRPPRDRTAIGMFVALSVVIAISGWITAPALLELLGTPPEITPLALAYLRVIFVSMPGAFLSVLLMMGLRGTGDALTPLWAMGLSVVWTAGSTRY
jgi:hypothetical protein